MSVGAKNRILLAVLSISLSFVVLDLVTAPIVHDDAVVVPPSLEASAAPSDDAKAMNKARDNNDQATRRRARVYNRRHLV